MWGIWFGFTLMRVALYLGAACIVLGLALAVMPKLRQQSLGVIVLSIVLGAMTVSPILYQVRKARARPYIHDLTTDTMDPPEFVDVAALRAAAPNPVEYGGEAVAEKQRSGYPELRPLRVPQSPSEVFDTAVAAAKAMGWDMVAAQSEAGRIEATDTTFWFGFKDDVVIRIRPEDAGSVIDIRSKSRIGGSDIGANAERIDRFLKELSGRLDADQGHCGLECE
ncbi:MAG: DUF1499 domain-containing protein [Pseudomonadota bacterium]